MKKEQGSVVTNKTLEKVSGLNFNFENDIE